MFRVTKVAPVLSKPEEHQISTTCCNFGGGKCIAGRQHRRFAALAGANTSGKQKFERNYGYS